MANMTPLCSVGLSAEYTHDTVGPEISGDVDIRERLFLTPTETFLVSAAMPARDYFTATDHTRHLRNREF